MAKISDLLAQGRTISFEFFPPKTAVGVENLKQAVAELAPSNPSFMSVSQCAWLSKPAGSRAGGGGSSSASQ